MENNSFGNYLSELRKEKGFSQRELAQISGVSNSTISRLESGLVVPDLITLEKIASALEIEKVNIKLNSFEITLAKKEKMLLDDQIAAAKEINSNDRSKTVKSKNIASDAYQR